MTRFSGALLRLQRPAKRMIMMATDSVMLPCALLCALTLKFDRLDGFPQISRLLLCAAACSLLSFSVFGSYRAVVRFMGIHAIGRMLLGVTVSVLVLLFCARLAIIPSVPLSLLTIYWAIALLYVGGSRLLVRPEGAVAGMAGGQAP